MEESGRPSSSAADSYVGSLISLTSKSEIRYEGLLASINTEESSISLQNVRSYGTEGREKNGPQIPPSDKIYEYIMFRGKDIKDLQVKYVRPAHCTPGVHHDPAIIQPQFSEGPLDSKRVASLGNTAASSMSYHGSYMSSYAAGSSFFIAPSIQDGNPSSSLYWHGNYTSSGIPHTSCLQEPSPQHPAIHSSVHLSSSLSSSVDPPPLTVVPSAVSLSTNLSSKDTPYQSCVSSSNMFYDISTKIPASLLPQSQLTATSLHMPTFPHSFGHKQQHSEVHSFATFSPSMSGVANTSALAVTPSANVILKNFPSVTGSVNDTSSSTFSIMSNKVPNTSILESELVANSIRMLPPTYGQEVNVITSPFQGPSALMPSLTTPGKLLQPGALKDSLPRTFDNDKESREAAVLSSKTSSFVSTLNTQRTMPSLLNHIKAEEYAEEFDFVAMNEKFKKDKVWGDMGKNVLLKNSGDKNENDVDELINQNDGAQFTKFGNRPVYVKDEFFDSISCGSFDRSRQNQHSRYSERTKVDTDTFGDFQQKPYTGRGRGYHANYGGVYYRGRGYRYGWRGRGHGGLGEQG